MITGFNTDVEHNGTVYHVQTEDKGLDTPFILSLVYVGGAILASKRAPYVDLVEAGFDVATLGERLQRQHKLICAAISAGRIEDLKRLSQRESAEKNGRAASHATPPAAHARAETPQQTQPSARPATPPEPTPPERAPAEEAAPAPAHTSGEPPRTESRRAVESELIRFELDDALHVELLEERDFRAGEIVTLRARVLRGPLGHRTTVANAAVTVKVLGTEFRPLILSSKSDRDGLAVVHVWLPRFTKGRAAILIRAAADGFTAELRRVIQHV